MTTHPPAPMPTERGTAVENENERHMTGPEQMAARALNETTDPADRCATDTTAGERLPRPFGSNSMGNPIRTKECADAEPDAGDVEALAAALYRLEWVADLYATPRGRATTAYEARARRLLASDWLAARDAAVRRKAADDRAERIAQAIEAKRAEHWQEHLAAHPYADATSCPGDYAAHDAYYSAARIARETR